MECGYASTYRCRCMHCSRPIAVHSLQVGVRLRDQAWGEVTKWLHPECAKPANVAKLKGFDELAPADQERLRSLAQDESPSLVSEPHRKRIRCVDQAQPTACSPAAPQPVATPPCRSETEWLRGCFDACTLDGGDDDGDGGGGRFFPPPPAPVLSCTGIQYPVRLPPHSDLSADSILSNKKNPQILSLLSAYAGDIISE